MKTKKTVTVLADTKTTFEVTFAEGFGELLDCMDICDPDSNARGWIEEKIEGMRKYQAEKGYPCVSVHFSWRRGYTSTVRIECKATNSFCDVSGAKEFCGYNSYWENTHQQAVATARIKELIK